MRLGARQRGWVVCHGDAAERVTLGYASGRMRPEPASAAGGARVGHGDAAEPVTRARQPRRGCIIPRRPGVGSGRSETVSGDVGRAWAPSRSGDVRVA